MRPELDIEDLVVKAKPAVVAIQVPGGCGSGVFVHPGGLVASNLHVIGFHKRLVLLCHDGSRLLGEVARVCPRWDLVLLTTSLSGISLPLGDSQEVRDGETVIAIGHPVGLEYTVTRGIVSARNRHHNGVDYIQTDVALNPGNSGGPLLNRRGELLGINSFTLRGIRGLNFALPSRYVSMELERLGAGRREVRAIQGGYCTVCGVTHSGADRYCKHCGARLPEPLSSKRDV